MSDIYVLIRNQDNFPMTSVDGIAFITLLKHNGQIIAEEALALFEADAGFDDLPLGDYTVIVKHEQIEPYEVICHVQLQTENKIHILRFIYLEPERVFLHIQTVIEDRL